MPFNSLIKGLLAIWQYRAVGTQTTSTGNAKATISAGIGNFFILDTLRIGADNYASARSLTVRTFDEDNNDHLFFISNAFDNVRNFIPSQNMTDGDTFTNSKIRYILISGDDLLQIDFTALLATETATIALRCYIFNSIPTITWSTSAGTIPVSTTLNKVVA